MEIKKDYYLQLLGNNYCIIMFSCLIKHSQNYKWWKLERLWIQLKWFISIRVSLDWIAVLNKSMWGRVCKIFERTNFLSRFLFRLSGMLTSFGRLSLPRQPLENLTRCIIPPLGEKSVKYLVLSKFIFSAIFDNVVVKIYKNTLIIQNIDDFISNVVR